MAIRFIVNSAVRAELGQPPYFTRFCCACGEGVAEITAGYPILAALFAARVGFHKCWRLGGTTASPATPYKTKAPEPQTVAHRSGRTCRRGQVESLPNLS